MDRYAISDSNVTFPRVGDSNQHQPTVKTRRYYAKRNMADQKPEIVINVYIF